MQLITILTALAAFQATAALPLFSDNNHTHIPGAGSVSNGTDETATRELNSVAVTQYGVFLCENRNFLGTCTHVSSPEKMCVTLEKGVSSVAPDQGVHCRFYYASTCVDKEPGLCGHFDLPSKSGNLCSQDPEKKIRSFWCGPASSWI